MSEETRLFEDDRFLTFLFEGSKMIYDANTWIGHWPFRSLPRRSAAELLKQMDKHGIGKALVASLHGLFYKDAHEANRELDKETRRHRDRLAPCAVLNPTYYGWQDDLKQCSEEFGMAVIRLTPDYHGYRLTDACAAEIAAAAHDMKMTVALLGRVVDARGRHRLDPGREASHDDVSALTKKFPKTPFLMLNFAGVLPNDLDPPESLYDITRILGANGLRLGREIKKHGAKRFVFGTTMLLRYGAPSRIALEKSRLTKRELELVQWKNLAKLVRGLS